MSPEKTSAHKRIANAHFAVQVKSAAEIAIQHSLNIQRTTYKNITTHHHYFTTQPGLRCRVHVPRAAWKICNCGLFFFFFFFFLFFFFFFFFSLKFEISKNGFLEPPHKQLCRFFIYKLLNEQRPVALRRACNVTGGGGWEAA
jgi:hypothetical protein